MDPRKLAIDDFAASMGVGRQHAQNIIDRCGDGPEWQARVEGLAALGELALIDAVKDVDEGDIEWAADEPEPEKALKQLVDDRAMRSLRARVAANARWAQTEDRTRATEKAREAALRRFENEVDPDGVLEPAERERRAGYARKAHMLGLALKSSKARRARKAAK